MGVRSDLEQIESRLKKVEEHLGDAIPADGPPDPPPADGPPDPPPVGGKETVL